MHFFSPSKGKISIQELLTELSLYIQDSSPSNYKIIIGTDSQTYKDKTIFVTAVIIQRLGKGARFFYKKKKQKPIHDLRTRIYTETELSLKHLNSLKEKGLANLFAKYPVEVHVDIGRNGDTRQLIHEVVGWVTAVGYTAKIKPDSFGASSVADKFTS
ncbi:hypothetical protein CIB95_06985 [Lottiidibacillus patelloidae]|uniref:DUF458 domain-containing protein n=1 Tax=Lottiidibacillus patelloidae TaxID=2670334 RepID=A0A263BTZ5_9BACI|nr:ribonuclease H-like YkuK family protein [Lottiidibacillus patelloidae]OZM57204.1 hypothetical protein CIB95_06985 [Lottiidibacillus patelloidae]